MKKILFTVLSLAFLAACTKDNNGNNSNSNQGADVKDIDGNTYPTVKICNQTWMAKNLNVSKYRNGDAIPQVQDATQWANLKTGAWCYYENSSANGTIYGKLYNWYAVNDARGLAPQGWHVPSDGEWTILTDCLGGADVAGGKLKEVGTTHWNSPNYTSNSSGFLALPGGYINPVRGFGSIGAVGIWWSTTKYSDNYAWDRFLSPNFISVGRGEGTPINGGFSVRCLKD